MRLRPIRRSDAARIQSLAEDPEVRAFTHMPDPYPADGAERWLREELAAQAAGTAFAMAVIEEGELVGICAVRGMGGTPRSGVIGYWIARFAWGRGLASEAVRQVVETAFAEHRLERIEAGVLASHRASRRVLEKNGFQAFRRGPADHPKWAPDRTFVFYRLSRSPGSLPDSG